MVYLPLAVGLVHLQSSLAEVHLHLKPAYFMRAVWPRIADSGLESPRISVVSKAEITGSKRKGGIRIATDNDRNVLILDGPAGEVKSLEDAIAFFDVVPAKVHLTVRCSWPDEGLSYSAEAEVDNQSTWETKWDAIGESTSIQPRINNDGTITLCVRTTRTSGSAESKSESVVRLKSGGEAHVTSLAKGGEQDTTGIQLAISATHL